MDWLGKHLKLRPKVVLGIYNTLRGGKYTEPGLVKSLIKEVMHKTQIDLQYQDKLISIFTLVVSKDIQEVKAAQENLGLKFSELGLIAKRLKSPKELPIGYMSKVLKFP